MKIGLSFATAKVFLQIPTTFPWYTSTIKTPDREVVHKPFRRRRCDSGYDESFGHGVTGNGFSLTRNKLGIEHYYVEHDKPLDPMVIRCPNSPKAA
jgi:hypothetical protein